MIHWNTSSLAQIMFLFYMGTMHEKNVRCTIKKKNHPTQMLEMQIHQKVLVYFSKVFNLLQCLK
jgi:hypothetical protein